MAAWRRKAIEAFPERRSWIERFAYNQTTFFYVVLLPMVHAARSEPSPGRLQKVFTYAAWCLRQRGSMVGVAFYEHLFDDREDGILSSRIFHPKSSASAGTSGKGDHF